MKYQAFFISLAFSFILLVFSNCSDVDDLDENPRLKSGSESGNFSFSNYSSTTTLFNNLKVERQGIWKKATGTVMITMTNCEGMTITNSSGTYTVYGCIVTDTYYSRLNEETPWNRIYQITYINSSSLQSTDATFSTQRPAVNLRRIWQDPFSGSYYDVDEAKRYLTVSAQVNNTTTHAYTYCYGYPTSQGYHSCPGGHSITTSQQQGAFAISDFQNL